VAGFDIFVFWRPPRYRRLSCLASDFVVLVLSEAVLSETVLVLDGCLTCDDADRRSKRFAGTCGPIGRIDILDYDKYEYRPPQRTEYDYEKKYEQCGAPKPPIRCIFSMHDAGWTVERIAPIGDDGIEPYWYPVALETISRGNYRNPTIKK